MPTYPEYKGLNLTQITTNILDYWKNNNVFQKSIDQREGAPTFVFYEGPPSANGLPGIHHVLSRTLKDIFCRYQTQKGKKVFRKAGWDTHGLPVELGVEKTMNITKEDIGNPDSPKYISVEDYNKACKNSVMQYTAQWNNLTEQVGYWVDLENPYITYENKYIESVWWLLAKLYKKGLLYKGYTIQPYSPAAGTGLSSHELNQPGCYKNVKDNTAVAMFAIKDCCYTRLNDMGISTTLPTYFLAWTTTPWTLPSNTALAVGKNIEYAVLDTYNTFTGQRIQVILAKNLVPKYFTEAALIADIETYTPNDKVVPYRTITTCKGSDIEGIRYQQLLPYTNEEISINNLETDVFKVLLGNFVTIEDGTGIVHIAPSFGADDFKVARENNIGSLTLVDKAGRFTEQVTDFAGEYVKEGYLSEADKIAIVEKLKNPSTDNEYNELVKNIVNRTNEYLSVDERIILKLQLEGKLFKKEKYEHSYPHCWRTDKPILYYPLDSWFIKTTDYKDRMIELNKTINWKPASTGTGRFGNWLENLQDWNLSRSRFWGIPLPIWRSEEGEEIIVIESVEQLQQEIGNAIQAGVMTNNLLQNYTIGDNTKENYDTFDLHKPYVDAIILFKNGKKLYRETDLIDGWFDSGAMPYAQLHYPFENKEQIDNGTFYPADYIAEGVDQTRGWFFTLHAIATMCFDQIAFKNVISNGLVLDKAGVKMSKRLGNVIDPVVCLPQYGTDAVRWYMIGNTDPWDNLKFNEEVLDETKRKFFGTLYNTYSFFVVYANIDNFTYAEADLPLAQRTEMDRWILSKLNTLIVEVDGYYTDYEPTKIVRSISNFVSNELSNWYIRLCRRRFWKGEYATDKIAAYQTLYHCLVTIAKLAAPIIPFYTDQLFQDLNTITQKEKAISVHLTDFPVADTAQIDVYLEEQMQLAQDITSMTLALRKKVNIRVRQPLASITIPLLRPEQKDSLLAIKDLVLAETNVKEFIILEEIEGVINKKISPNFKSLGKKVGKDMKLVANSIQQWTNVEIAILEKEKQHLLTIAENTYTITLEDVEITTEETEGILINSNEQVTVLLDANITPILQQEGIARDFVNRIQNTRKEKGLEVTDRITITIQQQPSLQEALTTNQEYICNEVLATNLLFTTDTILGDTIELEDGLQTIVRIEKIEL